MKTSVYTIFFCFLFSLTVHAQLSFIGISSNWNDSFSEWTIFAEREDGTEIEAEMRLKWAFQNNWTEWIVDGLGDTRINIKMKYANNPDFWELRSGNQIITLQTKWNNDFTDWRIKFNGEVVNWKADYRNQLNYWYYDDKDFGIFEIFTVYDGDPRDWEIVDQSVTTVPFEVNLACVFIATHFSSPKE